MLKTYYLEMKNAPNVQGKKQAVTETGSKVILFLNIINSLTNCIVIGLSLFTDLVIVCEDSKINCMDYET